MRDQEKLRGDIRPLVVNVMNFSKAGEGEPTLLSFDDARTLFHEFGHALHGLLSDVTYPMIAGTSVLTDWVELPSQLYEHWLERPEILGRFAVHCSTGEPIPQDLLRRLIAARTFNQGCATVEYVASALVDLDIHTQPTADGFDIDVFEQAALARIGMPAEIVMRHRPAHFQHIFSGGGYAAAFTATCGRRCSMPMPSPRSRKRATSSMPAPPSDCTITSTRPAELAIQSSSTPRSAAACRPPTGCEERGLSEDIAAASS